MGVQINQTNFDLDEFAIEVGIYFVFLSLCMYSILNEVNGDFSQLKRYFLYRKLEIFPNENRNTNRVANMLFFSGIFYCIAPFFLLLGWFILILFDRVQEEQSVISAWSLLIIGVAFIIFGFAVMSIKWNRFVFTATSAILIVLAFTLLTLYQSLVIFGYENEEKFLPYSSIYLCFNVIFMALYLFFDNFEGFEDVETMIKKFFKEDKNAPPLDNKRQDNFLEEVENQIKDMSW